MIPAELCENPHFSPTQAYSKTMKMLEANIQTSSCCLASLMRFFWSRLFFHTSCIISHLLLNFGAQKTAGYWKGPRHTLLIFWHESAMSISSSTQNISQAMFNTLFNTIWYNYIIILSQVLVHTSLRSSLGLWGESLLLAFFITNLWGRRWLRTWEPWHRNSFRHAKQINK